MIRDNLANIGFSDNSCCGQRSRYWPNWPVSHQCDHRFKKHQRSRYWPNSRVSQQCDHWFKISQLFSYLQVCIFFGISAASYVGFTQLIINLYNFSYLTLLISAVFNILFCIILAITSMYSGNFLNIRR